MYKEYYKFENMPFSIVADPSFVYKTENFKKGYTYLLYSLEKKEGPVVISGEIGSGKTTLCNMLIKETLQKNKNVKIIKVFDPTAQPKDMLIDILKYLKQATSHEMDIKSMPEENILLKLIYNSLVNNSKAGYISVLLIDDAHMMKIEMLEYICLLSNMEKDQKKLFQIILLAQPELNEKLGKSRLRQLNQRISERFRMNYLSKIETEEYIFHRLNIANSREVINFTKSAVNKIYKYSRGSQRVINHLCDRALLRGSLDKTNIINKAIVSKAIKSLHDGDPTSPKFSKSPSFFYWKSLRLATAIFVLCIFGISASKYNYKNPISLKINSMLFSNKNSLKKTGRKSEEKVTISAAAVKANRSISKQVILPSPSSEIDALFSDKLPNEWIFFKNNEQTLKINNNLTNPNISILKKSLSSNINSEKKLNLKKVTLNKILLKWINAWELRDLKLYTSFYSQDFRKKGMTNKAWHDHTKEKFDNYKFISVKVDNINFLIKDNKGEIKFFQKFFGVRKKGGIYEDIGVKTLYVQHIKSDWKIIKESWELKS